MMAGFDWQSLLPVLFLILWAVGRMFSKGQPADSGPAEGSPEDQAQAEERARQIREEIRRRLEERARQSSAPGPADPASPPPHRPGMPRTEPVAPRPTHSAPQVPRPQRTFQPRRPVPEPVRQPLAPAPVISLEAAYAEEMRTARNEFEVSRRSTAAGVEHAAAHTRDTATKPPAASILRGELAAALRQPDSARKAILYAEILGPPLASR